MRFLRTCTLMTLIVLFCCESVFAAKSYTEIEDLATTPILTPSLESRNTAKIRLDNGLEAYLISDPLADSSGATISVKVGSWEDPDRHPGMAHFLEHLLFLGTRKYPIESDYDRFITENGGISNAFTSNHYTSYVFEVSNSAFPEALDRFSSFFKEPLFNPSGVSRELQAIDQEYAKNIENDTVRELYVHKELTDPSHPYHGFNMGNSQTLSKVQQEELKEWYRNHYSANLMRLVVYSPLPLDKLKQMVAKDFGDIPDYDYTPLKEHSSPVMSKSQQQMIYINPVKDMRKVTLVWTLPPEFADMMEIQPETLVCYILGHEGKESLLAQLKREKLGESLSCGGFKVGPGMMQFYLEIGLTKQGLKHVNQVIYRCFQAIERLRERGIPEYIFADVKKVHQLNYQYQPSEKAFWELMEHARLVANEDMATYPEQSQMIQKYDSLAVWKLLKALTPENVQIDILASPRETGVKPEHVEKWIGVEYALRPIASDVRNKWAHAKPHPQIDIPPPNPYLPNNLDLVTLKKPHSNHSDELPYPVKIHESEFGKVYFKQDDRYHVPKVYWNFVIRTPAVDEGDPRKTVLADLYIKSVKEVLSDVSYPAVMAELDFSITRNPNGIGITVEGYSEKAHLLFDEILTNLKKIQLTNKKFQIYKESLLRKYLNAAKEMPLKQASELLRSVMYKNFTTSKRKATEIRKITKQDFIDYAPTLFEQIYLEGMLYGNMTQKQASSLTERLRQILKGSPYPPSEHLKREVVVFPNTGGPYYLEGKTKSQGNSVILAIQQTPFSFKSRAAQQVLMQGIRDGFFATLRTKQQTGYIVQSMGEELHKELFDIFAVQSNTHNVRELLDRFELFIEGYLQELTTKEIPPHRFEKIKNATLYQLRQPPKNMVSMGELLRKLAFEYEGDFDWKTKRIKNLESLTYDKFVEMAHAFLGRNNKRRFAVLLQGIIPSSKKFQYNRIGSVTKMRDLSNYNDKDTRVTNDNESQQVPAISRRY